MLLDEIKKREAREKHEEQEYMQSIKNINQTEKEKQMLVKYTILPMALLVLIFALFLSWLAVKGFEAERESETYTKVEHVTYIKPYKYETIKKSWVNDEDKVIKRKLLKVYKQDGVKDGIPQWKYVKTVDYGEKKPNM